MAFSITIKSKEEMESFHDQKRRDGLRQSNIKWNNKNPKANSAHVATNKAIRAGRLKRATICEEADETCTKRIEACHYDYEYKNALKVRWLCTRHHLQWDKKRKLREGEEYAF